MKKCNELNGKTWLQYSISVWDDIRKNKEELKLHHPALFPVHLITKLLSSFTTKEEKIVLDPFMGSGSTIVAATELGKKGIGFEISKEFADLTKRRFNQLTMFSGQEKEYKIYQEDASNIPKYVSADSVDICITSPPYWNILTEKRTADYKEVRNYGNSEKDLGRIADYNKFLDALKKIFEKVFKTLKPSKYCIVIVMDLRKKGKFYPYHIDVINFMEEIGFFLDDIIIWNRKNEYSNLRPLGYPSVFRINKIHEYVLILKTPEDKK